jgi:hypothetical protein
LLENDKIKQCGNWQKKSNRGGLRPGAGRPPGSRNKRNKEEDQRLFDACANALVKALDGALPTQVIVALWALGRPLREAREALGMTETAFAEKYGEFVCAFVNRQKLGMAAEKTVAESA